MTGKKAVYKSFLIRICCVESRQMWRITVTRINEAEEQFYFLNLDDLMIFLLQEIEGPSKGKSPMT